MAAHGALGTQQIGAQQLGAQQLGTQQLGTQQRRTALLTSLNEHGAITVDGAAATWQVHAMTIRRDFDALTAQGLARRVRGGLVALEDAGDFAQRRQSQAKAKAMIARKLRALVLPNTVVGLDASTTVSVLAEELGAIDDLTVVTNGMPAFRALHARDRAHVYLTGGEEELRNSALVGPLAEGALAHFMISTAIVSTMSLDAEQGASENTLAQASFKRALARAAEQVVLAVDSSKLGTRARFRSLEAPGVDVLVTELDPADPRLDPYRDQISEIL